MSIKKEQLKTLIISTVTQTFKISFADITKQVRKKEIVEARQVLIYCLRLMADMSFPEIGRMIGGRDHTTMMYACRKIAERIENDEKFYFKIEEILKVIRTPENLETDNFENLQFFEYPKPGLEIEEIREIDLKDNTEAIELESKIKPEKRIEYEIPKKNLEIGDREKIIIDYYRHGKTLEEISKIIGLTRERIKQIVLKTFLKEIGKMVENGFEIDAFEYIKGEKLSHKLAKYSIPEEMRQELLKDYLTKAATYISVPEFAHYAGISSTKLSTVFPEIVEIIEDNIKRKKDRWSRFYIMCRGCGTTTIPHARHGFCEKCINGISKKSRKLLLSNNCSCAVCNIDRGAAIRKYGRDLYITKDERILCRSCFLQFTGNRMVQGRWGSN